MKTPMLRLPEIFQAGPKIFQANLKRDIEKKNHSSIDPIQGSGFASFHLHQNGIRLGKDFIGFITLVQVTDGPAKAQKCVSLV